MSIFSHLRRSRQQAKEHNAKLAEQKKKDAQTTPYRHVPTHAAADAIASAPPAWREVNDRPRIVEQNRRRSAMAAAGFSMNMPSTTAIPAMPRGSSSLSFVSYPTTEATPHVGMPRAYSSNSIHYPYGSNRDVVYSMDAAMSQPSSWKGKEVGRTSFSAYDISTGSSTAVSKDPSPEGSSRASNSSHDELEMVTTPTRPKTAQTLQVPQAQPAQQLQTYHQVQHTQQAKQFQDAQQAQVQFAQVSQPQPATPAQQMQVPTSESPRPAGYAHRLHPAHRRTSSEVSDRTAVLSTIKPSPRDARPPPTSMRGFNFIPPAANTQPPIVAPVASKPAQPEMTSGMRQNTAQQRPGMGYSGFAPKPPAVAAVAPPAARSSSDYYLGNFSIPGPGLDMTPGPVTPSSGNYVQHQARSTPTDQQQQQQQQQQQPEMEPIVSNRNYTRHSRSEMPPPLQHDSLVNIFPEPVPDSYDTKSGRGKLNKSKKTRWSFSKSSPITA